jgi:hypothetical protein
MKVIITESQFKRLLNEDYKRINVRDIPNNLKSFSDKDFEKIESIVSGLDSYRQIVLRREDLDSPKFPRIIIMTNTDNLFNVMYLYKDIKNRFYVHTRQIIGRHSEQPLNTYFIKSLDDLPEVIFDDRRFLYLK